MPASDRESTMEPRDRRPAGDAAATETEITDDTEPIALTIGAYEGSVLGILDYIAEEQGFLDEAGIDAEVVPFTTAAEQIAAIAGGNLDIGNIGVDAAMLAREEGSAELVLLIGCAPAPCTAAPSGRRCHGANSPLHGGHLNGVSGLARAERRSCATRRT
jgi:ABC-type nitrate/sulfonate/bicarbonate transport system substrate-binding protein